MKSKAAQWSILYKNILTSFEYVEEKIKLTSSGRPPGHGQTPAG